MIMFDKMESFYSLLDAVGVYVVVENITISLFWYLTLHGTNADDPDVRVQTQ